jgi:hypothetical protein
MDSNIRATGVLTMTLSKSDGKVEVFESTNRVVDAGLSYIVKRMLNANEPVMSHMAIGTGTANEAGTDTALGAQAGNRVALTSSVEAANSITYTATFGTGTGTGAITEAGIFNAATAGRMLCRSKFSVINKGAEDTLTITWTVSIGA